MAVITDSNNSTTSSRTNRAGTVVNKAVMDNTSTNSRIKVLVVMVVTMDAEAEVELVGNTGSNCSR